MNKTIKTILATFILVLTAFFITACSKVSKEVVFEGVVITKDKTDESKEFDTKEYFFDRNETIYYIIYLENEKDYNISYVQINDEKLKVSKDDSTSTKLVVESNTGLDSGTFKKDIKVIAFDKEGKEKHAQLKGEAKKSIRIKARFSPVAFLNDTKLLYDEAELSIDLTDRDLLIDIKKGNAKVIITQEDKVIKENTLKLGSNYIKVENLKINEEYQVEVIAKFDQNDGNGEIEESLLKSKFTTLSPIEIAIHDTEETYIEFSHNNLIPDKVTIDKVELRKDGSIVKELALTDEKVEGLEKGTDYQFYVHYSYKHDGETIKSVEIKDVKTYELSYETVIREGRPVPKPDGSVVKIPTYKKQNKEVRGIWVSTVSNIDVSKMAKNPDGTWNTEAYKQQLLTILDRAQEVGFNTVFFQVRPMNDAFYPSQLAPFSRYVTGEEGLDPGIDILEFVIEESHKRDMELHAWLNPYRVATSTTALNAMDDTNFAKLNPELVLKVNDAYILNPGEPRVRDYIRDVIKEIMNNYPTIDGIHFDDYFYLSGIKTEDNETYKKYGKGYSSIQDFRRGSVNEVVKGIFSDVEEFNKENNGFVKFGISPTGIWKNRSSATGSDLEGSFTRGQEHYNSLYADSVTWIKEGWIHYILPQLYWSFNRFNGTTPVAPFATLVDWWSSIVKDTDVDLIVGQGLYAYRSPGLGWTDKDELVDQLRYVQTSDQVIGVSMFTYKDLVNESVIDLKNAVSDLQTNYWNKPAGLPWANRFE